MFGADDAEALLAEWTDHVETMQHTMNHYVLRQNELASKLRHQLQIRLQKPCPSTCSTMCTPGADARIEAAASPRSVAPKEQAAYFDFQVGGCSREEGGIVPASAALAGGGGSGGGDDAREVKQLMRSGSASSDSMGTASSKVSVNTSPDSPRPSLRRSRTMRARKSRAQLRLEALSQSASGDSPVQRYAVAFMSWWVSLKEPPRTGFLNRLLSHPSFDKVITLVIMVNTVYIAYQSNYEMEKLGQSPPNQQTVEFVFLGLYVLELISKLFVHRFYYWLSEDMGWNIFDTLLVVISVSDVVMMLLGSSLGNVTFARSLRMFKMSKILRIFRAMRFLKVLRVMMESLAGSLIALFWSFVMIGMILFVFSLLFMQQMTVILIETDSSTDLWQEQHYYFGSVQRSALTLLECTMAGLDWELAYRLIVPLGPMFSVALVFYIVFYNFAIMNILTGIFAEHAMKLSKPDDEERVAEERQKDARDMEDLIHLAASIDMDGTGTVKKDDFRVAAQSREFVNCFAALGINVADGDAFFKKVAGSDYQQEMDIEDFARRVLQARVSASSLDLHGLESQLQHGLQQMQLGFEQMQDAHRRQSVVMQRLAADEANPAASFDPEPARPAAVARSDSYAKL